MRRFGAAGINIFQNNGLDAGQHVPHLGGASPTSGVFVPWYFRNRLRGIAC